MQSTRLRSLVGVRRALFGTEPDWKQSDQAAKRLPCCETYGCLVKYDNIAHGLEGYAFLLQFYMWLIAVRSCSHETETEQAACDTINNETIVKQQEGNGKSPS